jgi:hypothetical protein
MQEDLLMGKSISNQIEESKKWLEKNSQSGLNLKSANAALAGAEKAASELDSLKSRMAELTQGRKAAMENLALAMAKVKMEKRLKAKEARVQARIAALSASE